MKNTIKSLVIAGAVIGATAAWAEPHAFNTLSHKKDTVATASNVDQIVYPVGQGKYRPFRAVGKSESVKSSVNVATSNRTFKRLDRNI